MTEQGWSRFDILGGQTVFVLPEPLHGEVIALLKSCGIPLVEGCPDD